MARMALMSGLVALVAASVDHLRLLRGNDTAPARLLADEDVLCRNKRPGTYCVASDEEMAWKLGRLAEGSTVSLCSDSYYRCNARGKLVPGGIEKPRGNVLCLYSLTASGRSIGHFVASQHPLCAVATPSNTPSPSQTRSSTTTATESPSSTSTGTGTSSVTASGTGSASASASQSNTGSATASSSQSPTSTGTSTPSATATSSASASGTFTSSSSPSSTGTGTSSITSTASSTGSQSPTATSSASGTGTSTSSYSASISQSSTPTSSATQSETPTASASASGTSSASATESGTASSSSVPTTSNTAAATASSTAKPTSSNTGASTASATALPSQSSVSTSSSTALPTSSATGIVTRTVSASLTRSPTRAATRTISPSGAAACYTTRSGVQNNLLKTNVLCGGWRQCHDSFYGDGFNGEAVTSWASIQSACNGANIMVACYSENTPNVLRVAANAPRGDVFFDTGVNTNVVHAANGVGWYYNTEWSLGFTPAGTTVNKNSCDVSTTNANQRLCIHAWDASEQYGYRCGDQTDINSGVSPSNERYHRVFYTR